MNIHTMHAQIRKQQRSIPNIVERWLEEFGEEKYDHHGGVILFFSKFSIKKMEKAFGKKFVQENKKYLNAYKVESLSSGLTLTIGWKH